MIEETFRDGSRLGKEYTLEIRMEGILEKPSRIPGRKTRAWSVLDGVTLSFFRENKRSSCIDSIDLSEILSVRIGTDCQFEIKTNISSNIYTAESQEKCQRWVEELSKYVNTATNESKSNTRKNSIFSSRNQAGEHTVGVSTAKSIFEQKSQAVNRSTISGTPAKREVGNLTRKSDPTKFHPWKTITDAKSHLNHISIEKKSDKSETKQQTSPETTSKNIMETASSLKSKNNTKEDGNRLSIHNENELCKSENASFDSVMGNSDSKNNSGRRSSKSKSKSIVKNSESLNALKQDSSDFQESQESETQKIEKDCVNVSGDIVGTSSNVNGLDALTSDPSDLVNTRISDSCNTENKSESEHCDVLDSTASKTKSPRQSINVECESKTNSNIQCLNEQKDEPEVPGLESGPNVDNKNRISEHEANSKTRHQSPVYENKRDSGYCTAVGENGRNSQENKTELLVSTENIKEEEIVLSKEDANGNEFASESEQSQGLESNEEKEPVITRVTMRKTRSVVSVSEDDVVSKIVPVEIDIDIESNDTAMFRNSRRNRNTNQDESLQNDVVIMRKDSAPRLNSIRNQGSESSLISSSMDSVDGPNTTSSMSEKAEIVENYMDIDDIMKRVSFPNIPSMPNKVPSGHNDENVFNELRTVVEAFVDDSGDEISDSESLSSTDLMQRLAKFVEE